MQAVLGARHAQQTLVRHVARGYLMRTSTGFAAARRMLSVPSESASGILQLLQAKNHTPARDKATQHDGGAAEGQVLSTKGDVIHVTMPGPVAVGQALEVDGSLGVVLQYNRRDAIVALVGAGRPRAGARVIPHGTLCLKELPATSSGVSFLNAADLVEASSTRSTSVFRLPTPPGIAKRQPIRRHLASGLAALEALLPLGEGHSAGFVGVAGTGKSTAAQMLMQSQLHDTVCVYAAHKPLRQLQARMLRTAAAGSSISVVYSDPATDSLGAQYLVPLLALQLAERLCLSHRHVLLVLDDLTTFAGAAAEMPVSPLNAPHVVAAAADFAGGSGVSPSVERALSVVTVLDLEPEDELPTRDRDLWRGVEQSLDVNVGFTAKLAAENLFPAIDVNGLLATGFPPPYQAPLFQQLRAELMPALGSSRDLAEKIDMSRQLGLHIEIHDEERYKSANVARALLSHASPRRPAELAVLLTAALIYHFPKRRVPSRSELAGFQEALLETVRNDYPSLWDLLSVSEGLSIDEATRTLRDLGEVLLAHRLDFHITRPDF